MKNKLIGVFAMAAGLMAFAVTPANAAGPFCIHLANFCDQVQIWTNPVSGNIYGVWDWTCVCDLTTTSVLGRLNAQEMGKSAATFGTRPVMTPYPPGTPFTHTINFVLHPFLKTLDVWKTDGVSDAAVHLNEAYTVAAGPCCTIQTAGGEPLLGRQ